MHTSVRLTEFPVEFINVVPVNPLISKCQIKVCYVSDEPNRNRSVITKEVAREIANSLPCSPIVGYYNDANEDFEEHNRVIDISNGKFEIKDTTRPYGFVDLNAKVWFAKYLDDDSIEREYMVTEGWLWTGQYPECKRILEQGNNQSMELDPKLINAHWTKDDSGKPKFFIINEAIISKLCILGEECEPCFEGSHITAPEIQFSFDEGFKEQLFSMMNELKELIKEGGAKVFTRYAVEIGDELWNLLYAYIQTTYPDSKNAYCSVYRVEGVFEEKGQKFAVLQNRSDMKYYRMNFSLTDESGFVPSETLIEVTKSYTPAEEPQFALSAVEEFETEYAERKKVEEQGKNSEENIEETEVIPEEENIEEEVIEEVSALEPQEESESVSETLEPVAASYSLEEIPEYVNLQTQFSELEIKYNALKADYDALEAKVNPLTEFKANAEKKEKEAMIASFYMLSDEDKADVVTNIDAYSLDDIEAKLSIICVRNKVNFNLDEDKDQITNNGPVVFNLDSSEDDSMPAWVKRAMSVAKTLN